MSSLKNTRIYVISPLDYTGIAYYSHSLCQSLSEAGMKVILMTSKKRAISPKKISYEIVNIFRNTYGEINRLKKGLFYILSLCKIYCYIIKNKPKIVHFQILELPSADLILFILLRMSGVKIVYTPHDLSSFKSKGNGMFLKMLFNLSHAIVAHNLVNETTLIRKYGIKKRKIKIVPHGNYNVFLKSNVTKKQSRERIGVSKNGNIILLFGSLRQGKGIDTVVKAFKNLIKYKHATLLMAGKPARGYDIEKVKKELKNEILKSKVILRDYFIEEDKVEYYYKASDIVLVPYDNVYESGVLRFAFSCGIPTIVSNVKEFAHSVKNGENCLVFKSGNAKDLVYKITILLNNPQLAEQIARNAKRFSDEKWDWAQIALETKNIYKWCCNE